MTRDLYAEIYHHFNVQPDRRGWVHTTCPYCGAEPSRGNVYFSFNRNGYNCYKCGARSNAEAGAGGLKPLAQKLGLWDDLPNREAQHRRPPVAAPPAPVERAQPGWKKNPQRFIDGYLSHPQRFQLWQKYKPVSDETIVKYDLGVGQLPDQKATRLIVPLYWQGECVGLKGRSLHTVTDPGVPKWIAATGSNVTTLWGFDKVAARTDILLICENYVDAALVSQEDQLPVVATGGARDLTSEEVAALKKLAPRHIVVAYDNDLAGQAQGAFRAKLEQEWLQEQRSKGNNVTTPPQSRAFPLVAKLRSAGMEASLFPWPDSAPAKADFFWALYQQA